MYYIVTKNPLPICFGENDSTCKVFSRHTFEVYYLDWISLPDPIWNACFGNVFILKNLKTLQCYKLHNVVFSDNDFMGHDFHTIFLCLFQRKSSVYKRSYFGCGVTEKMARPEKNICLIEQKFFRLEPNLTNRR